MEDCLFTHKDCGGRLTVSLTNSIEIISPSISISGQGISAGVFELRTKPGKTLPVGFFCTTCHKDIQMSRDEIEGVCSVCRKTMSVNELENTSYIPLVCPDCKGYITGEKKNPPVKIQKILSYMYLSPEVKFVKVSDILRKPLMF